MAKSSKIKSYKHGAAKRPNLPTEQTGRFMTDDDRTSVPYSPEVASDSNEPPRLSWKRVDSVPRKITTDARPLYIHEKIDPSLFIGHLIDQTDDAMVRLDAFNGLPKDAAWNWYKYHGNWQNRIIKGGSRDVMASLAAKEGMAGSVQMIYYDPPYGINFKSNYQTSTKKRDAGTPSESASVKAFRDTYTNGIHSYLDAVFMVAVHARSLLADSGSFFVQIGSANVHRLAVVLDEVFGPENRIATIPFTKAGATSSKTLPDTTDWILWYAKDKECVKYYQLYIQLSRKEKISHMSSYAKVELPTGDRNPTQAERDDPDSTLPPDARLYQHARLTSQGGSSTGRSEPFMWNNVQYNCPPDSHWRVSHDGLKQLAKQNRLSISGGTLHWKRYEDEIAGRTLNNLWHTQMAPTDMHYVVETAESVIERCILMTTDPGDLVLDPTCGSGTTAAVAEKWGRRWITIDTSAIPVALCRQRIISAINDWYLTLDTREGQQEEIHLAGDTKSDILPEKSIEDVAEGDPSSGFVYERIKYVSAASLAYGTHSTTILVNKPLLKKGLKRISSPFTVESLSPVHYLDADIVQRDDHTHNNLGETIIKALEASGIRNIGEDDRRQYFDDITSWPEDGHVTHQARLRETGEPVAIVILSDDETASSLLIDRAAEEAVSQPKIRKLLIIAFEFEASAYGSSSERRGKLDILKIRANRDLTVKDLKNCDEDNAFVLIGEPDIKLSRIGQKWSVEVLGYDIYDPRSGNVRPGKKGDIDCWMLDINYNGKSFFARRVHFPGKTDDRQILRLKQKLGSRLNQKHWKTMESLTSSPFDAPSSGRIAVRIVTASGDEMTAIRELPNMNPKKKKRHTGK